jgi:hypothetical protein
MNVHYKDYLRQWRIRVIYLNYSLSREEAVALHILLERARELEATDQENITEVVQLDCFVQASLARSTKIVRVRGTSTEQLGNRVACGWRSQRITIHSHHRNRRR